MDCSKKIVSDSDDDHQVDCLIVDEQKWIEQIHGGPITPIEKIHQEEIKHGVRKDVSTSFSDMDVSEIISWVIHYQNEIEEWEMLGGPLSEPEDEQHTLESYQELIDEARLELHSRHSTWHNPGDIPMELESACYCGWLGTEQPKPEFAPPMCNCIDRESCQSNPKWLESLSGEFNGAD